MTRARFCAVGFRKTGALLFRPVVRGHKDVEDVFLDLLKRRERPHAEALESARKEPE